MLDLLLFLIGHLFIFVKAGIEIPQCGYYLTNLYQCKSSTATTSTVSYCFSGNDIYVLGSNGSAICKNTIETHNLGVMSSIIVINNNVMTTITDSDLKKNTLDTTTQLPNMAIVSCMKYYSIGSTYYTCAQTTGIVSDASSSYYAITMKKNASNVKMTVSGHSCSSATIGSLITVDDQVELCVTKDDHAPLSSSSSGLFSYYVVKGEENEKSPFPLLKDNYLLIKTSEKFIIHDYNTNFSNAYVRADTHEISSKFSEGTFIDKLFTCTNGYCTEQTDYKFDTNIYIYHVGKSVIFEGVLYSFYNNNKGNVIIEKYNDSGIKAFVFTTSYSGVKVKEEDFKSQTYFTTAVLRMTYIVDCQNGQCLLTSGYIKYLNQKGAVSVAMCTPISGCSTPINYTSCTTTEIAYYDSKQSKFILCIKDYNNANKVSTIDIQNYNANFILDLISSKTQRYYLFEIDKNGDVVGYSKTIGNLYIDVNGDGVNNFIGCYRNTLDSYTECVFKNNSPGYFINIDSKSANNLIYCSGNLCYTITENNGYFTNKNRELIKCYEGTCLFVGYIKGTCSSDDTCDVTNGERFPSKDKIYVLKNVDTKYTYPEVRKGNDVILLEATTYSIKQTTTDEKGICYNKKKGIVVDDEKCSSSDLTSYYCSNICTSCTEEKNKKAVYDINKEKPTSCSSYIEDASLNTSGTISSLTYPKMLNLLIIAIISFILLF